MGKRLTEIEIKTTLRTIYTFIVSGTPKGKATILTAKTLNKPYITVKNHFDKWIKETLRKYLSVN